jgi:hypothetical protein
MNGDGFVGQADLDRILQCWAKGPGLWPTVGGTVTGSRSVAAEQAEDVAGQALGPAVAAGSASVARLDKRASASRGNLAAWLILAEKAASKQRGLGEPGSRQAKPGKEDDHVAAYWSETFF